MNPGDSLPDFDARTLADRPINYRQDVWQKKLAVLIGFLDPASDAARAYRRELSRREADLTAWDTLLLVVTHLPGCTAPAVVIADRWGEVRHVAHPADDRGLPGIDDLIEWLRFVQAECPECQGETR